MEDPPTGHLTRVSWEGSGMLSLFIHVQETVTDLLSGDVGQEMSVMDQEREKKVPGPPFL